MLSYTTTMEPLQHIFPTQVAFLVSAYVKPSFRVAIEDGALCRAWYALSGTPLFLNIRPICP